MAERYVNLFSLENARYKADAPAMIYTGALLLDKKTNRILVQLKFLSLSNIVIKAIKVRLELFDTAKREIENHPEFEYLDLSIMPGKYFGDRVPIYLEEETTRYFEPYIYEIVFSDNTVWKDDGNKWVIFSPAQKLIDYLKKPEIITKFNNHCGERSVYLPSRVLDLWLCTCGTYNKISCDTCLDCGCSYEKQVGLIKDRNLLKKEVYNDALALFNKATTLEELDESIRLFELLDCFDDSEIQIRNCKKKKDKISKRKKNKKIIIGIVSVATISVIVATSLIYEMIIKPEKQREEHYVSGVHFMADKSYVNAIYEFRQIPGYKDSDEQLLKAQKEHEIENNENAYKKAIEQMKNGELRSAKSTLNTLSDEYKKKYNVSKKIELIDEWCESSWVGEWENEHFTGRNRFTYICLIDDEPYLCFKSDSWFGDDDWEEGPFKNDSSKDAFWVPEDDVLSSDKGGWIRMSGDRKMVFPYWDGSSYTFKWCGYN